ncbi:MAG: hypothetical protein H6553_05650 [Chitinophagales bacterium]|nr:hypothetical protein [Chitinophagales bacterium]
MKTIKILSLLFSTILFVHQSFAGNKLNEDIFLGTLNRNEFNSTINFMILADSKLNFVVGDTLDLYRLNITYNDKSSQEEVETCWQNNIANKNQSKIARVRITGFNQNIIFITLIRDYFLNLKPTSHYFNYQILFEKPIFFNAQQAKEVNQMYNNLKKPLLKKP